MAARRISQPGTSNPDLGAALRGPAPRGRGTSLNPPNRFERLHVEPDPDAPPEERPRPRTQFYHDATETLLVRNESPDTGFTYGLNPYRGCEHGCAYCYARPYHEYLGWSSGLDFETKILVKLRAPELLRRELGSPKWKPQPIGMSGVTDCYQPAERHFRLTRGCLEVCAELRQPIYIITKNALITRDVDVLGELARFRCVSVSLSITTLDPDLGGRMEPRASRPAARLEAVRVLRAAGVPVSVMVAPCVPGLTDHELPAIVEAAARAGACSAGYLVLRLPHSVAEIFPQWLEENFPGRKARVMDRLRSLHDGKVCGRSWGERFHGQGVFAQQLSAMHRAACRRAGLADDAPELSTEHFRRPGGSQLELGL